MLLFMHTGYRAEIYEKKKNCILPDQYLFTVIREKKVNGSYNDTL